jgi:bisphosphoglycerate-dependent phosphoglycerate mutase
VSTYLYIRLIKPRKYNLSGETDANKNGLIQGQSNTPLSKIGIEQAKKIGEKFSSTKFDVAISSDLDRANQVLYLSSFNYIIYQLFIDCC